MITEYEVAAAMLNLSKPDCAPMVQGEPKPDPMYDGTPTWRVDGWVVRIEKTPGGKLDLLWTAPDGNSYWMLDAEDCRCREFHFWPEGFDAKVDAWPADPGRPLACLSCW